MAHERSQTETSLARLAQQLLADQEHILPHFSRQELEEQFKALQVQQLTQALQYRRAASIQQLLLDLGEVPPVGECVVDPGLQILYADENARQLVGLSGRDAEPPSLARCVAETSQTAIGAWQEALFTSHDEAVATVQFQHADGTLVQVLLRGQRLAPPALKADLGAHVLLHTVPASTVHAARVASICQRLLKNSEKERADLAREIHDGPMQELSSLLFSLNVIATNPKLQPVVESVKESLTGAIRQLREITNELRPPTFYHFGLETAVRSYVEQFQTEHPNLEVALFLSLEVPLDSQIIGLLLYRILGHALRNIAEHGEASSILVRLTTSPDTAMLDVEDDRTGLARFDHWSEEIPQRQTTLAAALDQVEALNGSLTMQSQPSEGTKISLRLPLAPQS